MIPNAENAPNIPVVRTDLAVEAYDGSDGTEYTTDDCKEGESGKIGVSRLRIVTEAAEKRLGRPRGMYITVTSPGFGELDDGGVDRLAGMVSAELSAMARRLTGRDDSDVMIAGLGNREMTPDAVGPETASRVSATRHVRRIDPDLFGRMGCRAISVLAPGVTGQTGIETAELLRAAVRAAEPDIVIAVDALAARSCERLGCTVQISDTGISPGSGVGNDRCGLDRESLGVPVIAVGVPTVVNSAVLVSEALGEAEMLPDSGLPDKLEAVLKRGRSFYVSPRESDVITRRAAVILSRAIENAFLYP